LNAEKCRERNQDSACFAASELRLPTIEKSAIEIGSYASKIWVRVKVFVMDGRDIGKTVVFRC